MSSRNPVTARLDTRSLIKYLKFLYKTNKKPWMRRIREFLSGAGNSVESTAASETKEAIA